LRRKEYHQKEPQEAMEGLESEKLKKGKCNGNRIRGIRLVKGENG
jgi:hypothetical protein